MLTNGFIAKATIRTSAVLSLRLAAQAGTLLAVAALLGAERFGAFAGIAALAVLLGSLATLGTNIRLLRDISRDGQSRSSSLPSTLGTTLAAGLVLLALYLTLYALAFQDLGIPTWVVLAVGLSEILLYPFITLVAAEHQAARRVAYSQFLIIFPLLLRLAGAVVVLLTIEAEHALKAYAAAYLAGMALSLTIGIRSLPVAWPPLHSWRVLGRSEWREASAFALLGFSNKAPGELDKILATQLLSLPAASAYVVAARIVGASSMPVGAMMLSALPRLFREAVLPDRSRLPRPIFLASLSYGLLAGLLLWSIAPLMPVLLGDGYRDSSTVLRLLSVAAPLLALRISASNSLMALGGPWQRFAVELSGAIFLPVAAIALHGPLGPASLPTAYVATELLMAVIGWALVASTSIRKNISDNGVERTHDG